MKTIIFLRTYPLETLLSVCVVGALISNGIASANQKMYGFTAFEAFAGVGALILTYLIIRFMIRDSRATREEKRILAEQDRQKTKHHP